MLVGIDLLVALALVGSAVLAELASVVTTQASFEHMVGRLQQLLRTNVYIQGLEQMPYAGADPTALFYGISDYTLVKQSAALPTNPNVSQERILVLNGSTYYLLMR